MAHAGPSRFLRCLRMRRVDDDGNNDVYETLDKPYPGSPMIDLAFGGVVAAQVVMAAFQSLYASQAAARQESIASTSASQPPAAALAAIDKDWVIYSFLGNFLGPTSIHSTVRLEVSVLRSTRSFETRFVKVLQRTPRKKDQKQDDSRGGQRQKGPEEQKQSWSTCFTATVDFCRRSKHARHAATGETLAFSIKPRALQEQLKTGRILYDPLLAENMFTVAQRRHDEGKISKESLKYFRLLFGTVEDGTEMRWLPGGLCEENLQGVAPKGKDILRQETSTLADASAHVDGVWFRPTGSLRDVWRDATSESEQASLPMTNAALSACYRTMILDPRPVVSAPLFHQLSFGRNAVGQSLDTAIRFHAQEDDARTESSLKEFQYVETISRVGAHGRYFGESSCFDREGTLVASCSQQCSLQVLSSKSTNGAGKPQLAARNEKSKL